MTVLILIKAKSYEALKRCKTKKFLESKPHRPMMAAATNKAAGKISKAMGSGATLQELSHTLVDKLKRIREKIVGKETVPRRRNCKHMRHSFFKQGIAVYFKTTFLKKLEVNL